MRQLEHYMTMFLQPTKQTYTLYDLGPCAFQSGNYKVNRHEFSVRNKSQHRLRGSFFEVNTTKEDKCCILYMHGFNSCRIEGVQLAELVTSYGINFCMFDFQAAGQSEGVFVTFGVQEQHDIQTIKSHLESTYKVDKIILWGRSMGATTSLFHCMKYGPSNICGLIIDSPFHDLSKLTVKMVKKQLSLPKLIIKGLIVMIRKQIEQKANFQFDEAKLPQSIPLFVPALFLASKKDTVIPFKYSQAVYKSYLGSKSFEMLTNDHNENRLKDTLDRVLTWSLNCFQEVDRRHSSYMRQSPQASKFKIHDFQEQRKSPTRRDTFHQIVDTSTSARISEGSKIKDRITKHDEKQSRNMSQMNYTSQEMNFNQTIPNLRSKVRPSINEPIRQSGVDQLMQKYSYLRKNDSDYALKKPNAPPSQQGVSLERYQQNSNQQTNPQNTYQQNTDQQNTQQENPLHKLKANMKRELSPDDPFQMKIINKIQVNKLNGTYTRNNLFLN